MKKPLPAPLVAVLATVSALVVLGIGFMFYQKSSATDTPTKQEEVERYNKAKSFYGKMGADGPPGAKTEAEMREKYPSGKTSGN